MQNPRSVSGGESIGDAGQQFDDLATAPLLGSEPGVERAAVHELGDEVLALIEFAGIVDGEDMRMVERGRHLRLALEAPPRRGIAQFL